jgi:hypothetical protein
VNFSSHPLVIKIAPQTASAKPATDTGLNFLLKTKRKARVKKNKGILRRVGDSQFLRRQNHQTQNISLNKKQNPNQIKGKDKS